MTTYRLISSKGSASVTGTLNEAVEAAKKMMADLQPAYGVSVEDESGATVAEIDE